MLKKFCFNVIIKLIQENNLTNDENNEVNIDEKSKTT